MPKLRFRSYICDGLSKWDDDHVAKTSPAYFNLELAQALDIGINNDHNISTVISSDC